jgi:hypothetical protein
VALTIAFLQTCSSQFSVKNHAAAVANDSD